MTLNEAKEFVESEIRRIERENDGKELRPWSPSACPSALEHWSRIQQRIALEKRDLSRACLKGLDITAPERTDAQRKAAAASGQRLARQRSLPAVQAA